jgi:glycosyltransferase involved in cell wall biosynthesis
VRKSSPELSYIISAFADWKQLRTCLSAIAAQTHEDFECIVTDNATDPVIARRQRRLVSEMEDGRFKYVLTAGKIPVSDCYWSSEYGIKMSIGRWLCMPCDDVYLPPEWAQRMLATAYRYNANLIFCSDSITGPRTCGIDMYAHLKLGGPQFPGYKPSFIVRRDKFDGWVNKPNVPACSGVDRTTLCYLGSKPGIRCAVCDNLFYFHN